jgi:hypothetical protein
LFTEPSCRITDWDKQPGGSKWVAPMDAFTPPPDVIDPDDTETND